MAATNGSGTAQRNSTFYTPGDWEQPWLPTRADTNNVVPGATARFTFQLKATSNGHFNENFNLRANSLHWFNYAHLGNFYIPITVNPCGFVAE